MPKKQTWKSEMTFDKNSLNTRYYSCCEIIKVDLDYSTFETKLIIVWVINGSTAREFFTIRTSLSFNRTLSLFLEILEGFLIQLTMCFLCTVVQSYLCLLNHLEWRQSFYRKYNTIFSVDDFSIWQQTLQLYLRNQILKQTPIVHSNNVIFKSM